MREHTDLLQIKKTDESPEPQAPGGVYLCQVNERVSCGACCGLYNVADVSPAALELMLIDRTERFKRIPREADAITGFGNKILKRQEGNPPYPDFHHCPFVGLVGQKQARVGCLLHPLATGNGGVDYRGLSYYGGMACRVYFCPTHQKLSREIKTVVRETAEGWYDYGLMVTESNLLAAFFKALEQRLGAPVKAGPILLSGECRRLLRKFSQLKIDWPFRRRTDPGPCHYLFDDLLYSKSKTTYPPFTNHPSPYDVIFRELGSGFETENELRWGEDIIGGMIEELALMIDSERDLRIAGDPCMP